ncbi:MAG TPA: hypothetical protein VFN61_09225 [Acidimicrobiales bacterium]|nr:hypothetical protein [Acidimicrobiales bacterium]
MQELLALVQGAGHRDFRDARGPLGFTQRQAGGRFTRDEADDYVQRLQTAEPGPAEPAAPQDWRRSAQEQLLRRIPTEQLAAELRLRGWMTIEPLRP